MEGLVPSTFHRVFLFNGYNYNGEYEGTFPVINGPVNFTGLFKGLEHKFIYNKMDRFYRDFRRLVYSDIIPIKYSNGQVMMAISPSSFDGSAIRKGRGNESGLKTISEGIDMPDEAQWFYVSDLEVYDKSSDGITKSNDARIVFENYHTISGGNSAFGIITARNRSQLLPKNFKNASALYDYTFYRGLPHSINMGWVKREGRNDTGAPPVYFMIDDFGLLRQTLTGRVQDYMRRSNIISKGYPLIMSPHTSEAGLINLSAYWNYPLTLHGLIPPTMRSYMLDNYVKPYSEFENAYNGKHVYDGNRLIIMETDLTNSTQFYSNFNEYTMERLNEVGRYGFPWSYSQDTTGGALGYLSMVENKNLSSLLMPTLSKTGRLSLYQGVQPNIKIETPMNLGVNHKMRNDVYMKTLLGTSLAKAFIEIMILGSLKVKELNVNEVIKVGQSKNNVISNAIGYARDGLEYVNYEAIVANLKYSYTDETTFAENVPGGSGFSTSSYTSSNYETRKLILPQTQSLITEQGDEFKNRRPFVKIPVNKLFKSVNEYNTYIKDEFGGVMGRGDNFIKANIKPWLKSDYDYVWKLWSQGIFDTGDRKEGTSKGRSLNDTDRRFTTN